MKLGLEHKALSADSRRLRQAWSAVRCMAVMLLMQCQSSCGTPLPAPELAAKRLAAAVERRDAAAVHALLDRESQKAVTVAEVASMLKESGPQILLTARAAAEPVDAQVRSTVTLVGGERVELLYEHDRFVIASTSLLPNDATTPLGAVAALRQALENRSYSTLLSVLTIDLAEQLEQRLSSLAKALRNEEVLDVQVNGDHAVIDTVDGHRVELELENGSWKISDIE